MSTYPSLNIDPKLLKKNKRFKDFKDLKYKTEKHDYEYILKTPKIDNEYYKRKYKSLNKKKVILITNEILLGSGSAITNSTM